MDLPCVGSPPLRDELTGAEYDCGGDDGRDGRGDCPPLSYCHKTRHYAKCCSIGEFVGDIADFILEQSYCNFVLSNCLLIFIFMRTIFFI